MSAQPGCPTLRARIASTLCAILDGRSHLSIADDLGVASTTVMRRGDDLHHWPATHLLQLAVADRDLTDAIIAYLLGTDGPRGSAVAAMRHTLQAIQAQAAASALMAEAAADGQIDPGEAAAALDALRAVRAGHEILEADLRVIAEGAA